jgi:preprotein translocase subunit SecD
MKKLSPITLHFVCDSQQEDCLKTKGEASSVQKQIELIIDQDNINGVEIKDEPYGKGSGTRYRLNWNKETQKKFFKLTQNNIGRKIAIVFKKYVIITPIIREGVNSAYLDLELMKIYEEYDHYESLKRKIETESFIKEYR